MATKVAIKTGDFVSGDLTANALTVTHNLGVNAVHVTVEDDTGARLFPDVDYSAGVNELTMTFIAGAINAVSSSHYRISL